MIVDHVAFGPSFHSLWATNTVKQKSGPHHTGISGPHPVESPAHLDRNTQFDSDCATNVPDFILSLVPKNIFDESADRRRSVEFDSSVERIWLRFDRQRTSEFSSLDALVNTPSKRIDRRQPSAGSSPTTNIRRPARLPAVIDHNPVGAMLVNHGISRTYTFSYFICWARSVPAQT
jgi:hypothetical protein